MSGEPGMGKSTLALKFASDAQKDFQAVLFQSCGRRSVEAIVGEMAATLKHDLGDGVSQLPPEEKLREVKEWLKQQHTLLVLDDVWLESYTEFTSQLKLQDLLPDPSVSLLFTSRRPSLPFVQRGRNLPLDAFRENEVEEVFLRHLGDETLRHHRQALMDFAQRVERLPIAVVVAAQLLQSQFGPVTESARDLKLEKLRIDDIRDVPGLLHKAIAAQGQDERCLLTAAATCVPEGFWLPFARQVAGLDEEAGRAARDNLVNTALLRVLDQETQRFQLHLLVRDQARSMAVSLAEFQQAHARVLEELFAESESRWRDCALCLSEIIPAVDFLRFQNAIQRAGKLTFRGFATAMRIGELGVAMQMQQRNEEYWKTVAGNLGKYGLQASYGNQALVLQAWGKLEEAMALHKKQEAICLEFDDKQGLQASYGNQALILRAWGKLEESMALLKKQEAICLELGNKESLQRSYANQGGILLAWGKLEETMALLKKQEAICLELGDKDSLRACFGAQALTFQAWEKLEEAMAMHKKEEIICLELGNKDGLQISYGNQAVVLLAGGKLEESMALLKKQETICLELGNKDGLGHCYWNWGLLAREQDQPELVRQKLEQALALFTELKMPGERDAVEAELKKSST